MLSVLRFINRISLGNAYFRSNSDVFTIHICKKCVKLDGASCQQVKVPKTKFSDQSGNAARKNALEIQMLSSSLHKQIFKDTSPQCSDFAGRDENTIKSIKHLTSHDLWGKETSVLPDVDFKLPNLCGSNIDEHFRTIALQQSQKYREYSIALAKAKLPAFPKKWLFEVGWTKYNEDGTSVTVDFPDESALVFDIETLVKEGHYPTIATAASATNWYSWCSEQLFEDRWKSSQKLCIDALIPLETKAGEVNSPSGAFEERIIIGHNVSFDRAFIKEQYFVKRTKMRFLDTMSLHIANAGLTGLQRALLVAHQTGSKRKDIEEAKARIRGPPVNEWMKISSLNNLADVYRLYCKGPPLKKEMRDVFVTGTVIDIRNNFQDLMTYCAEDVKATHGILSVVLLTFFKRFPHPVTFAGMLEMGCAYLPINQNWERYINNSQSKYDDLEKELKLMLMRLANDACTLLNDNRYQKDLWLWNLDWSLKALKFRKNPSSIKSKAGKSKKNTKATDADEDNAEMIRMEDMQVAPLHASPTVQRVLNTSERLFVKQPHLAGYPKWYRELCPKQTCDDEDWIPGPSLLSHQTLVTPKLMRLTWDGYPLHHSRKHGWGYLVPGKPLSGDEQSFPLETLLKMCPPTGNSNGELLEILSSEAKLEMLWQLIIEGEVDAKEASAMWNDVMGPREPKGKMKTESEGPAHHHGNGPYSDENVPGCWFFKLPHKDGPQCRVGNPLAKDFLNKIEDGTLKSNAGKHADWALKMSKMLSYWKNNRKRITSQMALWLMPKDLPQMALQEMSDEENPQYGAILPKIVTAGTVTRRAVEPTWLTASNAYVDRVGSELKAMIQAFPGYHFVGADVDSQELWIAAILGDAHFAGIHGCTAFGWMTLQGKKSNGTDMHSKTASSIGITRDQAKVMNYGRIYGAGQQFASRLLMQFNHRLTLEEAKSKAKGMYASTKGVRGYELNKLGTELLKLAREQMSLKKTKKNPRSSLSSENVISRKGLRQLLTYLGGEYQFEDVVSKSVWMGGTESAMFNKLEEIALSQEPKTPVLECQLSRALEAAYVMDNFMTSRINWVVQSSAVDYLHLMLVSMKWLFDTYDVDGRFSISIHDEVRYLVKSSDRYRAALALQITNLLTRSMFAFKLGMNDLPQSVAFFSTVDIDTVLRKEVHLDCKTPSNMLGLEAEYGILQGEAMDIYSLLEKTNGQLSKNEKGFN